MLIIDSYKAIAVVLALGCVTAEIILIIIFVKRYFENNKPNSILFLLLALFFILIGDGFGLVGMFLPEGTINTFTILANMSFIGTILSAIFFLFFYEIFDKESMFGLKQLFISIIGTLVIASFFLHDQQFMYVAMMDVHMMVVDPMTSDLNKILPVLTGIVVLLTIYRNYPLAWDKQQIQLIIMGIGAFIAYITPHIFIEPFETTLVGIVGPGLFMVSVRLWVAVGFVLFWYSFGSSQFFGFLQRQHAQKIVMIANSGIPVYTYNFRGAKDVMEDEMLFGGAITAIGSLFKESLGTTGVKDITLEDGRKLIFKPFEYGFSLVLITPKSSKYLFESLKRFGEKIHQKIDSIDDVVQIAKLQSTGNPILFESFGLPR
jgi:hypothetical protein